MKRGLKLNMGKKGGAKRLPNSTSGSHTVISLREEATGKLQKKASSNVKSILKLHHLKNLAVWASGEASIPPLGAFYGQCFASAEEAVGVPSDPSLITCERCETVLHPGFNCTVRIEKNRTKAKHRSKKCANVTSNNVVYKCHFCSHQNLKKGTLKGHMKEICPLKDKSSIQSKLQKTLSHGPGREEKGIFSNDEAKGTDMLASRVTTMDASTIDSPATPPVKSPTTSLLEGRKRKKNRLASNNAIEPASMSAKVGAEKAISTSSKRRKSWTSLKEIAQSNEHNSRIANLSIPFIF